MRRRTDGRSHPPVALEYDSESTVPEPRILPMASEAHVASAPAVSSVPPSSRFANRELSWLDFDARVLALAEDNARPLLERVRFLAIFSINLDEFFQIRVAGLKEQVSVGLASTSPDGMTAREQLDAISRRVRLAQEAPAPDLGEERSAAAGCGRDQRRRLGGPPRRRSRASATDVRETGVPDPHAAVGGPRPSVPVHLRSVAEPRRRRARSVDPDPAVRACEGAAEHRRASRRCPTASGSSRRSR